MHYFSSSSNSEFSVTVRPKTSCVHDLILHSSDPLSRAFYKACYGLFQWCLKSRFCLFNEKTQEDLTTFIRHFIQHSLIFFLFPKKIMSVLLPLIKHTKRLTFMFSVNTDGLFQQEGLLRSHIVLQLLN